MRPVDIILIGAGDRGSVYAQYAKTHPEVCRIVAVAEPREFYRNRIGQMFSIKQENIFRSWEPVAARARFADAAIIATQDKMHTAPAVAFAQKGYHMLLEKPLAVNFDECELIANSVKKAGIIFSVCHVLRYTNYTRKLKEIIDAGIIGDIVNIQHLEPVGFDHQAHSFVRGNWRNESESTFMLLAKACHDLDWISYIMKARCCRISSFGSLKYFRAENKPHNASERCLDCLCEPECPYSAVKLYLHKAEQGMFDWPVNILTSELTVEGVRKALEVGPYGRCVFSCDNDVVDNQVVNMEFEDNSTASFTMTAFNKGGARTTRIFGTKGELYVSESNIGHFDFLTQTEKGIEVPAIEDPALPGHSGGDYGIMDAFVRAVKDNNPELIVSGADTSLASHRLVFTAEMSRRTGKTICVQ